QRIDRLSRQSHAVLAFERPEAIQGVGCAVDDPAEQLWADSDRAGPLPWNDAGAGPETLCISGRHQVDTIARESNYFGGDTESITGDDIAIVTDRGLTADRLQCQSYHSREGALHRRWGRLRHSARTLGELFSPDRRPLSAEIRGCHGSSSGGSLTGLSGARSSPNALAITALTRLSNRTSI